MKRLSLLALTGLLPLAASAQTYSENFDTDDSAKWNFASDLGSSDLRNDNIGNEANFSYNYGSIGIPSAPHSVGGTTIGMNLEANVVGTKLPTGALGTGFSVSPIGQSFTGDYTLQFDAWQQILGPFPAGGSGSTQVLMAGIGSAATQAQSPYGTVNGLGFGAASDSGTSVSYRAYNGTAGSSSGATFPGTQAYTGGTGATAGYYNKFQGSIPTYQSTNYASTQTGSLRQGTLGMAWHTWDITKTGSIVTWSVDGLLIATATVPVGGYAGSDIFFGQFDVNASPSTNANSRLLNFGIVDNITVTPVPEPAPIAALALGALAVLRRRKRA